jgi:hypothetical protein
MSTYRVSVRLELRDDDTGRVVTYDNFDHYFDAVQADGGNENYQTIGEAIDYAIRVLTSTRQKTEARTT